MGFQKIHSISRYGVFRDIDGDRDGVPPFSKRNLIYGWNYSGKTTLSRLLRSFSTGQHHPDFLDSEFRFILDDGIHWGSNNLSHSFLRMCVFNSDYVSDNIKWDAYLDPILIIGDDSIDLQNRAQTVNALIKRRTAYRDTLNDRTQQLRKTLDDAATEVARQVRQQFGHQPFNREPHLQQYIEAVRSDPASYRLSDADFYTYSTRLTAKAGKDVPQLSLPHDLHDVWSNARDLLARTAHQETIAHLRENPDLERWVESGLQLHQNKAECEFCGNTIPQSRIEFLAGHFSKQLQKLKMHCDKQIAACQNCLLSYNPVDSSRLYEDLQPYYEQAFEQLQSHQDAINSSIQGLIEELRAKKSNPDLSYAPVTALPQQQLDDLIQSVETVNKIVNQHRSINARLQQEKHDALQNLIHHKAAEFVIDTDYERSIKTIDAIRQRLQKNADALKRLNNRLEDLNTTISGAARGADEINRYLRLYFGKNDIQVTLRGNGTYELRRGEYRAKNLSEGEKTAIAFSYFLATIMDGSADLSETVVVIDDPVSSLDSHHIYNTFAMIKTLLADAHQVFLLTHNYELFRIARTDSFFHENINGNRRGTWYLVSRISRNESTITGLPDSLRTYNSEYHYIFCLLYGFLQNPDQYQEIYFNIPNLLRKLLETYTSFRMPATKSALNERLKRIFEDEVTAMRVYRFVNHLSHGDTLDTNMEFPAKQECVEVVAATMEALGQCDPPHYESMTTLAER